MNISMLIKNDNRKTAVSLITSIISSCLSFAVSFFLSPYIVANFGEEANGFAQLASNFVNYATLITVALNSMAARFIAIEYHKGDLKKCEKFYSSVFAGNLFIIAVLIGPALFCVLNLESILNIETANIFHIKLLFSFVFTNFFVALINSVLSVAVYVKNAQYLQNITNMANIVLRAVGLLLLFTFFAPKVYYVSLTVMILTLLSTPLFYYYKSKLLPEIKFNIKSFDIKAVWELISSGIWNTINQCGNLLMTGLDLLLSNLFIGPLQMGVLSVSKVLPNAIIHLAATVNTSFSPNLTIAYAAGDKNKILASLRYAMKSSSLLVLLPIIVLSVYGKAFYGLWVPNMDASQLSMLSFLTCMQFIPLAGTQALYNVYTTANKLKWNSITVLVGGFVNFAVVYLLLKYTNLGLLAVVGVSSVVSLLRNLLFTIPYAAKILKLKWYTFYKEVGLSCLCGIVICVCCLISRMIIQPNGWISMILSVMLACILGFVSSFVILMNREERGKWLKTFIRKNS